MNDFTSKPLQDKIRKSLPKRKLLVKTPRVMGGGGWPTQFCPETLKRECYSGDCKTGDQCH